MTELMLTVDLGGCGEREAQMEPGGAKLVRPDGDVEPGTIVA